MLLICLFQISGAPLRHYSVCFFWAAKERDPGVLLPTALLVVPSDIGVGNHVNKRALLALCQVCNPNSHLEKQVLGI